MNENKYKSDDIFVNSIPTFLHYIPTLFTFRSIEKKKKEMQ